MKLFLKLRIFGALTDIFGDEVVEMDVEDYRNCLADTCSTSEKKVFPML